MIGKNTDKYLNEEIIARSVANPGNTERLQDLFRRANDGEKLTIAFLGGSITQGCLSSTPELCYAYLVYDWFVRTFPKASFTYVNAGIGGTTSQFAAARLDEDVLEHKPDYCMVEFSVNDSDNVFFKETYESVVSRLLESKTQPAVMILHNLFYENGHNAQKQHLAVGKAYDVPCVSVRDAIYPEIEAGKIQIPQLSSDGLHPNDDGHAVLATLVTDMLENILHKTVMPIKTELRQQIFETGSDGREKLTATGHRNNNEAVTSPHKHRITLDAYCTVRRFQNRDKGILCRGFVPDNTPKENMLDIFRNGWKASKTGDEIEFAFTGTELGIQYRKTIRRPAPVAVAVIDGDEEHPVILDANFDQDWGDSLHIDTLLYHGHRVDPSVMYGDFDTVSGFKPVPASVPYYGHPDRDNDPYPTQNNPANSCEKKQNGLELTCMPPVMHKVKIRITETHENDVEVFYLVSFIAG